MLQKIGWPLIIVIILLIVDWSSVFTFKTKDSVYTVKYTDISKKIYVNKKYGFQLTIPDTWDEYNDSAFPADFAINNKKNPNSGLYIGGVFLDKNDPDLKGKTFDEFIDEYKKYYKSYKILSDDKIIINGLSARLIKAMKENKNIDYLFLIDGMKTRGVYQMLFVLQDNDPVAIRKELLDIVLSFKVLQN